MVISCVTSVVSSPVGTPLGSVLVAIVNERTRSYFIKSVMSYSNTQPVILTSDDPDVNQQLPLPYCRAAETMKKLRRSKCRREFVVLKKAMSSEMIRKAILKSEER